MSAAKFYRLAIASLCFSLLVVCPFWGEPKPARLPPLNLAPNKLAVLFPSARSESYVSLDWLFRKPLPHQAIGNLSVGCLQIRTRSWSVVGHIGTSLRQRQQSHRFKNALLNRQFFLCETNSVRRIVSALTVYYHEVVVITVKTLEISKLEPLEPRLLLSVVLESQVGDFGDYFDSTESIQVEVAQNLQVQGIIESWSDRDFLSFTSPVSGGLRIDMQADASNVDSMLIVYDEYYRYLGSNDNTAIGSMDAGLTVQVHAGQQYYVEAKGSQATEGAYTLTFALDADLHGNSLYEATEIQVSAQQPTVISDGIEYSYDYDYLQFIAPITGGLQIQMQVTSGGLHSYVAGYNQSIVAMAEHYPPPAQYCTEICMHDYAGQTYYVLAYGLYGTTGQYELTITFAEDNESDTLASATEVQVSDQQPTVISGGTEYGYDYDYFQFIAPVTGGLQVQMQVTGGGLHSYVAGYNQYMGAVAANYATSAQDSAEITMHILAGQTYYVLAYGLYGTNGDYELRFDVNVDDLGGSFSDSSSVSADENGLASVTDGFDFWGDVDMFHFTSRAGAVTIDFAATGQDGILPYMYLYDNAGRYLQYGYTPASSSTSLEFEAEEGMVYYIQLRNYIYYSAGGYQVDISGLSNSAPSLNPIGHQIARPGETLSFTISGDDANEDPITYSASNLPAGATFDPETQTFTWTPTAEQKGPFPNVRFTASDGFASDSEDITITAGYVPLGKGATNAYYIDNDADGYGVGPGTLGRDADDNDADVNTPETMLAQYGTVENFVNHLGYNPDRISYLASDGDDASGDVDNILKPYLSWNTVRSLIQPGDLVMFREGVYGHTRLTNSGLPDKPIVIMAFPGETVILDDSYAAILVDGRSNLVFDGFITDNTLAPGTQNGILSYSSAGRPVRNVTFRNIETRNHQRGWVGGYDHHDILVENSVFHDSSTHGIYLASNATFVPNTNLTVRNSLSYNNGRHGFQHNGRVTNLLLEGNIFHSNTMGGVSFLQGVSDSIVRNNLIFNNAKMGIQFYLYEDADPNIQAFDQTGNLVVNNTFWVGQYDWKTGSTGTQSFSAVLFNDNSVSQTGSMDDNMFRNNIFVTYFGSVFKFSQERVADSTIIENNVIYKTEGAYQDTIMTYGGGWEPYVGQHYNFTEFEGFSELIRNNLFQDPEFRDVSVDYFDSPENFDFDLVGSSPILDFGVATEAPVTDLRGNVRTGIPDAGCYEY